MTWRIIRLVVWYYQNKREREKRRQLKKFRDFSLAKQYNSTLLDKALVVISILLFIAGISFAERIETDRKPSRYVQQKQGEMP